MMAVTIVACDIVVIVVDVSLLIEFGDTMHRIHVRPEKFIQCEFIYNKAIKCVKSNNTAIKYIKNKKSFPV